MFLDSLKNPVEFQSHGSKVMVTGPIFWILLSMCDFQNTTLVQFSVRLGKTPHFFDLSFYCLVGARYPKNSWITGRRAQG